MFRLRRNHGTETPGAMVFIDTESNERLVRSSPRKAILSYRLACATYIRYEAGEVSRRDTLDTDDWMAVWDWIESKQSKSRPLWVFGHNLGFDLTQLHFWEQAQLGRFRLGSTLPEQSNGVLSGTRAYRGRIVADGFPFYLYCLSRFGVLKMVDTLNYYPVSLEKVGEEIGFPKLEWPGFEADDEAMRTYCRRDVDITERLMLETLDCWRESDGGVWQPTAAMLALTSFRHKLPRTKRPAGDPTIVYDDKDEWTTVERGAYYGGQVTCFYVGPISGLDPNRSEVRNTPRSDVLQPPRGPLYLLDVRSLYPGVMRDRKYPFRRLFRRRNPTLSECRGWLRAYGVIASVAISSAANEYVCRTPEGQQHCTGRFTTSLAGPELERALDAGDVESVHEAQVYCLDYLFRDWVDDWTRARDRADRLGERVKSSYIKMILNSLSGKFAQCGEHWVERHDRVPPFDFGSWMETGPDDDTVSRWRAVAGVAQERVAGAPPWYTFPSISAYVCSYGREHMRWLRSLCPERTVLYQATDSLIVTDEGYYALRSAGLIRDNELGYLRVEKVYEDGEIFGSNHYRLGDRWVMSGVKRKAVRMENGTYSFTHFEGTSSILATQPDGTVTVETVEVMPPGRYRKGHVGKDGWVTWTHVAPEEPPLPF